MVKIGGDYSFGFGGGSGLRLDMFNADSIIITFSCAAGERVAADKGSFMIGWLYGKSEISSGLKRG